MKINLVTVVGYNTPILPHMLKHYENMVDKIYLCVYTDHQHIGILNELEELNIKPYKVVVDDKFNWYQVTKIYNEVKRSRPNDWWIVADDDELQIYPDTVESIVKHCDNKGYDFVTGGFLDRIGTNGTFPKVPRDTDIHKLFPNAGFFRYPMSGACPNKVTLMKGYQDVTDGQHYADFNNGKNSWGKSHPKRMPIEECFTQVHHFKWDSTILERLLWCSKMQDNYKHWYEYRDMYNAIADNDMKFNLKKPEYLVEDLSESSYIGYTTYSKWSTLINKIVKI
tara:strand:+ start:4047 stop:4889 length:843 start_codon:yes stop_codon:yes gene_type:complete